MPARETGVISWRDFAAGIFATSSPAEKSPLILPHDDAAHRHAQRPQGRGNPRHSRRTVSILTLNDFPGTPKVVEDADTFAGNATKKAVELAHWICDNSKLDFVLADDSGLEVDALNGAPGVHSARFAALDKSENSHDADNNAKLLRLLKDVPLEKRTGRFRCVIALVAVPAGKIESASPVCFADDFEAQVFDSES